jgi:hypothetical protein
MPCRQCGKPVKVVNEYTPVTCGGSSCQEAEYHANMERAKPKKRKLQPKEGAKKADGTTWKKVPGGLQKLEINDPPAEGAKERKLNGLVETLRSKIEKERDVIASFTKSLAEDPSHAFEWSKNSFTAAARLKVYDQAHKAITQSRGTPELYRKKSDGTAFNTLDNLIEFSQKEVNRRASSPSHSSSPTTNLMEQEYLAAWADILEMILWS